MLRVGGNLYQGVDNMSEKEIQKYVEEMKKFAKSKSRSKKNCNNR